MKFSSTYQPTRHNTFLVFVYGTLLSNCGNHYRLEHPGAKLVGKGSIRAKMFTAHWGFPHIIFSNSNKDRIVGEIYEVNTEVLRSLDNLEGYNPHQKNSGYCLYYRKHATTDKGLRVWVYEAGQSLRSRLGEYIPSGDWKKALLLRQTHKFLQSPVGVSKLFEHNATRIESQSGC